jgi:hypothetical protein
MTTVPQAPTEVSGSGGGAGAKADPASVVDAATQPGTRADPSPDGAQGAAAPASTDEPDDNPPGAEQATPFDALFETGREVQEQHWKALQAIFDQMVAPASSRAP